MIIPISIVIPFNQNKDKLRLWVQERQSRDSYNGMLEFPGGKIESDEDPEEAAVREVQEETSVTLLTDELLKFKNYDFQLGDKTILLMVFLFNDRLERFPGEGYVCINELLENEAKLPPKNIEILTDLIEYFQ